MAAHPVTEFISSSAWALVEDKFSPYAKETLAKLVDFVQNEVVPAQRVFEAFVPEDPATRWTTHNPVIDDLKIKARKLGLWNLFLSKAHYPEYGVPLTNLEASPRYPYPY